MKMKTISQLNDLYRESENADKEVLAEYRTSLQLISGDHYNRQGSRYWSRLREPKQSSPDQRLRLSENHIGKIAGIYRNAILSYAPGVKIRPKNESELQDQKAAELHQAVWQDIKHRHKIEKKVRLWAKDFVEMGEVCCKIYWDEMGGQQIGWRPAVDEAGVPVVDPMTGQPVQGDEPVMSGDLVYEMIHPFDMFREPSAKSMDESQYIIIRKMASTKDLKLKYEGDEDKQKMLQESSQDTFRVFETNSYNHRTTKDLTMIREFYFKPCFEYPNGMYYITTEDGVLECNELPFGIFPIIYESFEETTTSPRGYSIIRRLRPVQIEINRALSAIAQHQVTIGDTKVFLASGSKPSSGTAKPGIRYETISGPPPTIVPGQTGEQYFGYLESRVKRIYEMGNVPEELEETQNQQVDPYAMLFRSMKQKKKFSIYIEKFESFLKDACYLSLNLMKKYAPKETIVLAAGRNEQINITEFKSQTDLGWQIIVDPVSDDIETMFGKQLTINNMIQYVGKTLKEDDIGKLIRLSPYLNKEEAFKDKTQEWDNSVNDILALDRGEYPEGTKYEEHKYQVKRLVNRTKQADFRFKPNHIKQLYDLKIKEHEQAIAEEAEEIKRAQSEFIPSGGYAVACDLYVSSDANDPSKTKRLRVPSEALQWLVDQLDTQGSTQEALSQMPGGLQAEIARMLSQNQVPEAGQPMVQNLGDQYVG